GATAARRHHGRARGGVAMKSKIAGAVLGTFILLIAGCDLMLSPDQRVARAESEMARKDYRAAIIELKNALQDEPNHVRARSRLAQAEFHVGDLYGAEQDLKRALQLG